MATLAALLKHAGNDVSGSDEHVYPPMSDFLAAEGITVLEGYRPAHVAGDLDLVVIGNAISRGNAELEAVLDRHLRYTSLPEAIRDQWLWNAQSIVIAGTHGKTTTTSLTGWLLTAAGADPTVLIGGIARNFGRDGASYRVGQGKAFVIEGDEYDSAYFDKTAKFLKYLPDIAVVNNIEFDHADIYANLDEVRLAFKRLVNLVPQGGLTLLGIDSPDAAALAPFARSRVQTFGLAESADWRAVDVASTADTAFTVVQGTRDHGGVVGLNRHPGLDPGSAFFRRGYKAGRPRLKAGVTSFLRQRRRGLAAIVGAFAADLGAQFAMFMVVALAFGGALFAHPRAQLEQFAQHRLVVAGAPRAEASGGLADIRTIEAQPDALRHVRRFGHARVGAAQAHFRAIHQMMDGIAERLVVAVLGVERDHLANGHGVSLVASRAACGGCSA